MGHFFVNLPLRLIAQDSTYLDFFLQKKLDPELGLDAISLESLDLSWHEATASTLLEAGRECSIHLPFHDLQPGSIDDLILQASRERLQRAMRVASLYSPRFLVGHNNFIPLYTDFFSKWLSRATQTWRRVLEVWPDAPPLYLENVREQDPRPIEDLLGELADCRVKFCFDTGHWFSYGGGSQYGNLSVWMQTLSPYMAQMHLHDNEGVSDQHLGLGQGTVPWDELFDDLECLSLSPGITLEQHEKEELENSLRFMQRHFGWFSSLGVRSQDLEIVLE